MLRVMAKRPLIKWKTKTQREDANNYSHRHDRLGPSAWAQSAHREAPDALAWNHDGNHRTDRAGGAAGHTTGWNGEARGSQPVEAVTASKPSPRSLGSRSARLREAIGSPARRAAVTRGDRLPFEVSRPSGCPAAARVAHLRNLIGDMLRMLRVLPGLSRVVWACAAAPGHRGRRSR
jgi:hypothetical protein